MNAVSAAVEPGLTTLERPRHCRSVVLVLQGGGALGAYQAGAYATLAEAGYQPSWIAGVSIGAINAALIAGNAPERRLAALRAFWERVADGLDLRWLLDGDQARASFRQASALDVLGRGVTGFFTPRLLPPWLAPAGGSGATSCYDTAPLRATLSELVDFDLIDAGPVRLSVGAVDVASGNSVYFDSARQPLGPEHVMASGALPPGFPPVEIEGLAYWDGGVVSNTPLDYVLDDRPRRDHLIFQIDLFSARGRLPRDLLDVMARQKEITYSSRTRVSTNAARELMDLRRSARRLLEYLPRELRGCPEAQRLQALSSDVSVSIVHLIYRSKSYESHWTDYEFSRTSMEEHWQAGVNDARRTLRHPVWLDPPGSAVGVRTVDAADSVDHPGELSPCCMGRPG